MYRASRRTGMYLYSSAWASAPFIVRAPRPRGHTPRNCGAREPFGIQLPVLQIVDRQVAIDHPVQGWRSDPAGAFHTPRAESVRA